MSSFSERLRAALSLRGMTQQRLELDAKLGTGTVSRWLSGARGRNPSAAKLNAAAGVLRVRPEWLFEGRGPMEATERSHAATTPNLDAVLLRMRGDLTPSEEDRLRSAAAVLGDLDEMAWLVLASALRKQESARR